MTESNENDLQQLLEIEDEVKFEKKIENENEKLLKQLYYQNLLIENNYKDEILINYLTNLFQINENIN
jgi:hypothetical protein